MSEVPIYLVWIATITKPYTHTFESILTRSNLNRSKAYNWMFIGTIGFAMAYRQWFGFPFSPPPSPDHPSLSIFGFALSIGIMTLFGLIILIRLIHAMAVIMGGSGSVTELTFIVGSIIAPLGILAAILSFIPFLKYTLILLLGYILYLLMVAVKST